MISGGKQTAKNDATFAALKARLAQGKGKASPISTASRSNKTSWSKRPGAKISKGNPTFAVSGATPGVKKPGNKA
jgi:hypothetical protein